MRILKGFSLPPVGFLFTFALMAATPLAAQTGDVSAQTIEGVPQHANFASIGVVLGLRGQAASSDGLPVTLAPDAHKALLEPVFRYDGFLVSNIQMESFAAIKDKANGYRVLGVIVFEDAAARRVYTEFAAYYTVSDTGIVIDWASARTRTPPSPTILWFAVDGDDLSAEHLTPANQFGLMQLLESSALNKAPRSGDHPVAIYAVSMDRFAPGDMPVTTGDTSGLSTSVFDLGGWPAAIFQGEVDDATFRGANAPELRFPDGRLIGRIDSFPTRPDLFQ